MNKTYISTRGYIVFHVVLLNLKLILIYTWFLMNRAYFNLSNYSLLSLSNGEYLRPHFIF